MWYYSVNSGCTLMRTY